MGFFKAYDMRGTFGTDFDLDLVCRIGQVLPGVVGGTRWLIGRDGRETGGAVRDALVRGLAAAGADITDLGLCTTPMVYHFTDAGGFDGSVMITASHNPPSDNGLKVSRRGALPVGYADGLDKVEAAVKDCPPAPSASAGAVTPLEGAREKYLAWQRAATDVSSYASLRLAVDCSNGVAALLAKDLFPGAILLNDTIDGRFPCHSPNPLLAEAREQIAEVVRSQGLDAGVIFDGDADRAMFVDERGDFVPPDMLIPVVARQSARPGEKVLHDVRTSRGAIETLREQGFEPVMVPVGHVFAKRALRETHAACGGELAGHYYFREFHNCDSGVLAAMRVLAALAQAKARGETFSQMMAPIRSRYANSGERNFRVEDKAAATARVLKAAAKSLPDEISRATLDGLRVEYAQGWFNLRASNTEPYLRLVVEADTPERLDAWLAVLTDAVKGTA